VARRGDTARLLEVDGHHEELVASASFLTGAFPSPPEPMPPLPGARAEDPYASGDLFHGPALQVLRSLVLGRAGSSSRLDASGGGLPRGLLNPALLDGGTHGIPHARLHLWSDEIPPDRVAYPVRIPRLDLFGPTPSAGEVRCETRFVGFAGAPDLPAFHVQLIHRDRVWADLDLVEACFPKGPLGAAPPRVRRAFLRDREFVSGVGLAAHGGDETVLDPEAIERSDWLPGTVAALYGTRDPEAVAVKEHLAAEHRLHPGNLPEALPLTRSSFTVERQNRRIVVRRTAPATLDLGPIRAFWTAWFDRQGWTPEDLCYGLIEHFIARVVLVDPSAYASARGTSLLYLGNHQVGIESFLFSIIASGLNQVPTVTLAKIEHRVSWLGRLIRLLFSYPGVRDPEVIAFFDRSDRTSLPDIIEELAGQMKGPGRSVMVHVEGTRSLSCRTPVTRMSGAFLDMALHVGAPVVPVRFIGALPAEPVAARLEFPVGMGRQEVWIGRPIPPSDLAPLPYGGRKRLVVEAINALGPRYEEEQPLAPRPELASSVAEWVERTGASPEHATLFRVLQRNPAPCPETARILAAATSGRLEVGTTPTEAWLEELAHRLFGERGPRVVHTPAAPAGDDIHRP
jgi:1-acyl-sn-glycerol-3-phosphate acyltransferase